MEKEQTHIAVTIIDASAQSPETELIEEEPVKPELIPKQKK